MTVQHVRDLAGLRRTATLVAAATSLETNLTDATLLMFDKLMGSLARKAERRTADNSLMFWAIGVSHAIKPREVARSSPASASHRAPECKVVRQSRKAPHLSSVKTAPRS
jgi:hypothetical protein